ncbi:MAG: DUF4174 domain-containing protein [Pseudomonadota bacterium]
MAHLQGRTASMIASTAIALSVASSGLTADNASAMGMYRWKNRPVLIFAPSAQDARLQRQRSVLMSKSRDLRDRDMVVIAVIGNSVRALVGRAPGRSAASLRKRFGVGGGSFRVLLVGKDGGVKLSSGAPISSARLFSLIDAMPMRRQEMRERR